MCADIQPDQIAPARLVILGSTGSIGKSALDLVRYAPDHFRVVALTGHRNIDLLYQQAQAFRPEMVAITDDGVIDRAVYQQFSDIGVGLLTGADGARQLVQMPHDLTIAAIVGAAGLSATFEAARQGGRIALANKESVVCGGALFMETVRKHQTTLLPIDSEHNAIFQVMHGADAHDIRRLILTASGGPFRDFSLKQMATVTVEQALAHPTWSMGSKISIDSATMMNKGLEIIEAHHLFDVTSDKIDVLVHPQSVIHSMVEYHDGSILAQMGTADMRIPIAHAMAWPKRMQTPAERLDFTALSGLSFAEPDLEKFPCLRLARNALECGRSAPIILNAANEVAVAGFLTGKIGFLDIARITGQSLDKTIVEDVGDLAHVLAIDARAREMANRLVQKIAA